LTSTRTRAIDTPPLVENSAIPLEPQIPSDIKIVSVNKSPEPMQEFGSETASLPRAQIAPVPLPLKKPAMVYGKGAKGIPNVAHQKAARQKQTR
jgi:hypothetical protein